MKFFRDADPSRRVPVWLQAHTKENFIWQLEMTVLLISGFWAYDAWQEKKLDKKLRKSHPEMH